MGKKVVILGGGVAGMSAAHELVERGFDVEVYERQFIPGGKARSTPVFESLEDRGNKAIHEEALKHWRRLGTPTPTPGQRRPWLPGEHGFRFFPAFYRHIIDTMARIPYGDRKVSDNLVDTTQVMLAREGGDSIVLPSRFPQTQRGIESVLDFVRRLVSGDTGIPLSDVEFFAARVWQFLTSCRERRQNEYEKISWWDFVGAGERSAAYQQLFAHGFTRSLVASQAQLASAWTVGSMHLQLLFDIADPTVTSSDRLLNGPTNVVWIRPWLDYLESQGVRYNFNATVEVINCSKDGRVQSITVGQDGERKQAQGDYYVAALPVERIAPLLNQQMITADPHLRHLPELAKNVAWMSGIQFYIKRRLPIAHGHVIYVDSPWALTSVSQAQFWKDHFNLADFGDGDTRDILSVDISDWHVPGTAGLRACECDRDEIADEVWRQLKNSLNVEGREVLQDEDQDYWFLDPDIQHHPEQRKGEYENVEPLLVNLKDTWRMRPEAITAIPNFFLASDYVRTYTDLATMEGANEAARRAVNGILMASRSTAAPCELWPLHEPEVFQPLCEYDRVRWEAGLHWDDRWLSILLSALDVVQRSTGFSAGNIAFDGGHTEPSDVPLDSSSEAGRNHEQGAGTLVQAEKILSILDSLNLPPNQNLNPRSAETPARGAADPSGSPNPPPQRSRLRIVQK